MSIAESGVAVPDRLLTAPAAVLDDASQVIESLNSLRGEPRR